MIRAKESLMERICELPNLTRAWHKVRGNIAVARRPRSCGVDEISVAAFEQNWEANLAGLRQALLDGSYRPLPVRRVALGKPGGGRRTIGVLAVRDRIAQRAAQQVLEPLFEEVFLDCSFGFRPNRSVDDAVRRVLCYRQAGCAWAFHGDVQSCFDNLDHGLLLRFLGQEVREREVLGLLRAWLEAGLMEVDAETQREATAWERFADRAGAVAEQAAGWATGSTPECAPPVDDGYPDYDVYAYDDPEWDSQPVRNAAWRRLRGDVLLLGLSAARPLARYARLGLKMIGPRGAALGAVGLAGAAVATWWLSRPQPPGGRGALQGGALSPLLANVVLHRLDLAMTGKGHNLVRYSDDVLVCCRDEDEARAARQDTASALADLRLMLNADKARVVSFDEGFQFLGRRFRGDGLAPGGSELVRREAETAVRRGWDSVRRLRNRRGHNREEGER
jgi:RNA-directed DNA polymerase